MTVSDVEHIMEEWAPLWTALDRDNVGLQFGRRNRRVSRIMIALEITGMVVQEAAQKRIDLIVTHHPPLFHPLSSLTDTDQIGRNILALVEKNVAVYSAHTNLDFTRDGVSFTLAKILGLQDIRFLSPLDGTLSKIVVFVPPTHVEKTAKVMSECGAGVIGEYEDCSFRVEGTGTFKGSRASQPYLGNRQSFEHVNETRLEMVAPTSYVPRIVQAIKRVHPYEEVAYDVYPLNSPNVNYGMGAFGKLDHEVTLQTFLQRCKRRLSARSIRFTGNKHGTIKTVAVCGGSGSDLLEKAVQAKADAFVTADVRYHTFHAAHERIALIDAGHWETEHCILEPVRTRLTEATRRLGQRVSIMVAQTSTNPVKSI